MFLITVTASMIWKIRITQETDDLLITVFLGYNGDKVEENDKRTCLEKKKGA